VERSWFEPALLLVLIVVAGLVYAWYTGAVGRTLGSRDDHPVATPTTR
jgi:hypothetical protein